MTNRGDWALGIDIGGTNTKVALVGREGHIEALETIPTRPEDSGAQAPELVRRITESAGRCLQGYPAEAAGVAVAGFVDDGRESMIYNPNLPWLADFPLKSALSRALGMPVVLEVDSNAACLAEYRFGSGRGASRFLCLTAGTGLGGGMVVNGDLLRFTGQCLGDVGHVVLDADGPACSCGGRGCAEALVAQSRIVDQAGCMGGLLDVIQAAREGHLHARSALESAGRALGLLAASLAQIFQPDRIAFAGGLSEAGGLVLDGAQIAFLRNSSDASRDQVRIVTASLGRTSGVIGAAAPLLTEDGGTFGPP
ncbi:MAG: ROK family protein [Bryobacteraceae bacterium]